MTTGWLLGTFAFCRTIPRETRTLQQITEDSQEQKEVQQAWLAQGLRQSTAWGKGGAQSIDEHSSWFHNSCRSDRLHYCAKTWMLPFLLPLLIFKRQISVILNISLHFLSVQWKEVDTYSTWAESFPRCMQVRQNGSPSLVFKSMFFTGSPRKHLVVKSIGQSTKSLGKTDSIQNLYNYSKPLFNNLKQNYIVPSCQTCFVDDQFSFFCLNHILQHMFSEKDH